MSGRVNNMGKGSKLINHNLFGLQGIYSSFFCKNLLSTFMRMFVETFFFCGEERGKILEEFLMGNVSKILVTTTGFWGNESIKVWFIWNRSVDN